MIQKMMKQVSEVNAQTKLVHVGSSDSKIQLMSLTRDLPEMRYLSLDLSNQIQENKLHA